MQKNKRGELLSETTIGLIIGAIVVVSLLSLALTLLIKEDEINQNSESLIDQVKKAFEEAKKYSKSEISIPNQISENVKYFLVNFQDKNHVSLNSLETIKEYTFFNKENQLCLCLIDDPTLDTINCENYCLNIKTKINNLDAIPLNKKTYLEINYENKEYSIVIKDRGERTFEGLLENPTSATFSECTNYLERVPLIALQTPESDLNCNEFPEEFVTEINKELNTIANKLELNLNELILQDNECKKLVEKYEKSVFIKEKMSTSIEQIKKETIIICTTIGTELTEECLIDFKEKSSYSSYDGIELKECLNQE